MKKLKGICLALLTVVLSVAMLMGTLTLSAFAATTDGNITVSESNKAATFTKRVKYGVATDAFKGATKIVTPNGKVEENITGAYTPTQIGVYTVYYGDYSYNVSCYQTGEYELRVDYNGAEIATYMEVGKKLTVPAASVWYKGEDDTDFEKLTSAAQFASVTGLSETMFPEAKVTVVNGNYTDQDATTAAQVDMTAAGTYTVHYYARVGGDAGTVYLHKDYTTKVQQSGTVNDTTIPTLNVVNIPDTISLNTLVTLPKATATDNYDENVKVEVTVEVYDDTLPNPAYRPVRTVEIDEETGYAKSEKAGDENNIVFDNEYTFGFYPTVNNGRYRITYQAFDDAGNFTNKSTQTYTATCTDRTAPVLKKIADEQIPGTWGLQVTRGVNKGEDADGTTVTLEDTTVTFPYPEYYDNSGNKPTVKFEIKDTTNNFTVVSFSNIYDQAGTDNDGKGSQYTYDKNTATNGIYNPKALNEDAEGTLVFDATNGFTIDFAVYEKSLQTKRDDSNASAAGSYTVSYQAYDAKPNYVTKTYDITLESTFNDTDAPSVSDLTWQENYLVFTEEEEEFVIPTPEISDTDTNPEITYKLFAGADDTTGIDVKGGEVAKLQLLANSNDDPTLVPTLTVKGTKGEADQVLKFPETDDTLEYYVSAKDNAGNITVRTNGTARATAASVDADTTEIAIVNGNELGVASVSPTFTPALSNGEKLTPGVATPVGTFTVALSDATRKYYGFELSLYIPDENDSAKLVPWTSGNVELYTYYDGTTLHIQDIKFAAPRVEKVVMYLRIYDVAGNSYTVSEQFDVDLSTNTGEDMESALNIGTSGSVYTSYILKNSKVKVPTGVTRKYVIRKISGNGKFSLLGGSLFTAYNAGSFTFTEYYDAATGNGDPQDLKPLDVSGSYDWKVTETATPVWQIQDEMPTYTKLASDTDSDGVVVLPHVVASTAFANAKIDLAVSFAPANGSTKSLTVAKDENDTAKDVKIYKKSENEKYAGQYYFTAKQDGTYTVTYTATYGDNEKLTQAFTIKAGDIVAPTFTVDGTHKTTATENSRFKFNAVKLSSTEDTANVRYTKTLEAPDGSTVFTVDGTGESYRTATTQSGSDYTNGYKFTKTGVYTVRYTVTDKAGNASVTTYTVTVSAAKVNNPVSTKIISTILIIVGVLLIAGVILYFIRFRKVKSK